MMEIFLCALQNSHDLILCFCVVVSVSAKYSKPSNSKGSRLMLVNEVGLGRCLDLFEYRTELDAPPEGYDSVHGVKATDDVRSDFKVTPERLLVESYLLCCYILVTYCMP